MSDNLTNIITLCQQRKRQQLFNIPPPRIEIVSPYINNNVTKFQLDMRRKAEVLKHDHTNTKQNNLTKKQLYTQVINGNAPPISNKYIRNYASPNLPPEPILCNNTDLPITTPSSASGVPNDYINGINVLYSDPTVELYNYINPVLTRSYGVKDIPLNTNIIQYSNYVNVNTDNSGSFITSVEFTDATTNPSYTLNIINIPLAFQTYGDIIGTNVNTSFDSIKNPSFELKVYFNNQEVTSLSNFTYTFIPTNDYTIDISSNVPIDGSNFAGTFFIGYLSVSNISLFASPGYIYDFKIITHIENPSSYSDPPSSVNNITTSLILNVTNDYLIQHLPYNCKLSFSSTIPIIQNLGTFTVDAQ